jgi:ribose 5-phosphate isomerase B
MEVHLGSDHRGFELKQLAREYLAGLGHDCHDHGAYSSERSDYPEFASHTARALMNSLAADPHRQAFGVVICGSGVGISIAANKVPGVRCAVAWCEHIAEYTRRHNHANMLAFGADLQTWTSVQRCLDAYLAASEEGGRHAERVAMIERMEAAEHAEK